MSETIIENNRVTAGYTLKVPVEGVPYSSQEATVFIPYTIPDGATPEQISELAGKALTEARITAAKSLGVGFGLTTDDDGVEQAVLEIKEAFPGAVEAPKAASRSGGGNRSGGGGFKGRSGGGGGGGARRGGGGNGPRKVTVGNVTVLNPIDDDLPDWLGDQFDALVECGQIDADDNEVWDNRKFSPDFGGTGKANAPWFKTSQDGKALDFGGDPVEAK